jgi:glyoxylase-like metal-dependent hydrolase (beta-lactamase superfamily II)
MKKAAVALGLLFMSLSGFAQAKTDDLQVWAFRYGTSLFPEKAVFRDGKPDRNVDFAWLFFALRREGRWILVDTGFDDPAMVTYFHVAWTDPIALLAKAGIRPEDVSQVLLTHAHFDHLGLADRFPKARLIMSEAARKDAVAHAAPPALRQFFRFSRQIDTFHGKLAIDDGLVMEEIDGHAPGSCVIRLPKDKVVFSGDEAYLPENWTGPRANGSVANAKANQIFLASLKALGPNFLILTHHDPAIVTAQDPVRRIR